MKKRAFTLIELLIAISILAILLTLIVPAVMKARAQVHKAKCLNNLKQIMIALNLYATDHEGRYPNEITTRNAGGGMGFVIVVKDKEKNFRRLLEEDYIDNVKIFGCPATGIEASGGPGGISNCGYLYNVTTKQIESGGGWWGAARGAASNYPLLCDADGNHLPLSGHVGYVGGQVEWMTAGDSWPWGIPSPDGGEDNPPPFWSIQD